MNKTSRIYVAGHTGLVGSAIVRTLRKKGHSNIFVKAHDNLDLTRQLQTESFFERNQFEYVIVAAARVGGIYANSTYPVEFLYQNLLISLNLIRSAALHGVKKLLFLGSSCMYPRNSAQPIKPSYLLTGALEPTNEAYALAKISGVKLCQYYRAQYDKNFIAAIPCNLYGPGDNFDPMNSHVIPGMMRKFHEATLKGQDVTLWGTGHAKREFMHVDDLAEACYLLMNEYNEPEAVNVGAGFDLEIHKLAKIMAKVVGFTGKTKWTRERDGMLAKLMDSTEIHKLGFVPKIALPDGLLDLYRWARSNQAFDVVQRCNPPSLLRTTES